MRSPGHAGTPMSFTFAVTLTADKNQPSMQNKSL
jgi:hypothetical protein